MAEPAKKNAESSDASASPTKKSEQYLLIRCMGHKSVTLRQGQTLKIGRHGSNDFVLKDGTVSRFHASLAWDLDEDRPYVEDHDSANGVEVDGEPIEGRAYLSGDNHVDVGDFTLILQLKGATKRYRVGTDAMAAKLAEQEALNSNPTVVRLFSEKGRDLTGRFESIETLQRIFLTLEDDARTGTLTVKSGARAWKVTLSQGLVVTAIRNDVAGVEALRELLGTEQGTYKFTRDLEPSEECLNLSPAAFFKQEAGDTMSID